MPNDVPTPATTARDAIAAEVRAEMARQSKSYADLGDVLGVTRQSVHLRLRGHQPFRGEELVLIARWLGVPAERFLPEVEPIDAGAS
jgi:transcriptional regulator with XRE-family HTH domain